LTPFRLEFKASARRDLKQMPLEESARIVGAVEAWARGEPHVDVEKLTDVRPPEWRIRVGRRRALIDRPEPGVIRVLRVLDRKDAYRR